MYSILIVSIAVVVTLVIVRVYLKKMKEQPDCSGWTCNQPGQICNSDNQTWICDGATWHQVINPDKLDTNNKDKYVKECNDWSCNKPGQICPPRAQGAENRYWICDGETWHQAVKPF
jgi:hypothetical protein